MSERPPLIIFANFVSEVVGGRAASELFLHGMAQTSRKVWLLRPGDVLVTEFPVSEEFRGYACGLLGVDPAAVTCLEVPPDPALPLAEALEHAGLIERLRAAVAERPGIELLPIVVDRPTVRLAAELGVPVHAYGPGGVPESAVAEVARLNTKCGFRTVAADLGLPVPPGRCCPDGPELADAARTLLETEPHVLVKPSRAAGGHGLRAFGRADLPGLNALIALHRAETGPQPEGWVVERRLDVAQDVSVQIEVTDAGPETVFTGRMRTRDGSFHGFVCPLPESPAGAGPVLREYGLRLGGHLAAHGYRGRLSLDAAVTAEQQVVTLESNVRRTATTARHALTERLAALSSHPEPAWIADSHPGPYARDIGRAQAMLRSAGLDYDTTTGEGVVLATETTRPGGQGGHGPGPDGYGGHDGHGGGWHYTVIAGDLRRAEQLEQTLHRLLRGVSESAHRYAG